ncbi:MAG: alpha/beta fold hydrolase [Acidobacteriota bacterium]
MCAVSSVLAPGRGGLNAFGEAVAYLRERRPFVPHPLMPLGDLQTVCGAMWRREFPPLHPVVLHAISLRDGGIVEAEWVRAFPGRPVLLVVHGMAGSCRSCYVQALAHKALQRGWNALLPSFYDRRKPSRRRLLHAGSSDALQDILDEAVRLAGGAPVFLVGVSLGGNICLKCLGELGEAARSRVAAAVMISPLVDLSASWRGMEARRAWLYRRYFVSRLREAVVRERDGWSRIVDVAALEKIRTIREFDEIVTVPLGGFASVFHYYEVASAVHVLDRIAVPTLVIHALDDPILPVAPLRSEAFHGNPHLALWLTRRGGHVGFIERTPSGPDRAWAENRAVEFFARLEPRLAASAGAEAPARPETWRSERS